MIRIARGAVVLLALLVRNMAYAASADSIAGSGASDCAWRVAKVRELHNGDRPLDETLPYAVMFEGKPTSVIVDRVPGPNGLSLVVETDSLHHGQVYLEDSKTRKRRLLQAMSGIARWSPDGHLVACLAFRSRSRPYQLLSIDWRTGTKVEADTTMWIDQFLWSPDSRWLAARTTGLGPVGSLVLVDARSGRSTILDRPGLMGDFEFSWSPDSRWIAYSKPSAISEYETGIPTASDVWITDLTGRNKCRILESTEVESEPRWIGPSALQVTRPKIVEGEVKDETLIYELAGVPASSTPK